MRTMGATLRLQCCIWIMALAAFPAAHAAWRSKSVSVPARPAEKKFSPRDCFQEDNWSSHRSLDIAFTVTAPRWRDLNATLASLLLFRTCKLHLHFMVDEEMEALLRAQFAEMALPLVQTYFILMPRIELNGSTFSPESLQGVVLDSLIDASRDSVVALDTDMLIVDDICPAKLVLQRLQHENSLVGLAPEMAPIYMQIAPKIAARNFTLEKPMILGHNFFSARPGNGGLNGGVVFWNLQRAREMGWSQQWRKLLEVAAIKQDTLNSYPLGDQDVWNLVCQDNYELCSIISNDWNYQLIVVHEHKFQYPLHGVRVFHGNNRAFTEGQGRHLKRQVKSLWNAFAGDEFTTGHTRCSYLRQARTVFETEFAWLATTQDPV